MAIELNSSTKTAFYFQNHQSPIPNTAFPPPSRLRKTAYFSGASFSLRTTGFRTVSAVSERNETPPAEPSAPPVRIVALVGDGSVSPLKCAPWVEVMIHTAQRLQWVDEGFQMLVFTDNLHQSNTVQTLQTELNQADVLVIVAVTKQDSVEWIQANSENIPNIICFDSSPVLVNKLGGSFVHTDTRSDFFGKIPGIFRKETNKSVNEVVKTVSKAWRRRNSDDIRFCILVIINAYIKPVQILKNLRAKGFSTFSCMVSNCSPQILNCLLDPGCRKALQCLNDCSPVC